MALVTCGPADSHLNPVCAKRFFGTPQQAIMELQEPKGLCLGTTAAGGSSGIAILDGYAAVIEVNPSSMKSLSS